MTAGQLEAQLRGSLQAAGHATIPAAVLASNNDGAFDSEEFTTAFDDHLKEGRFRLVFVLDAAPPELMALVSYLENVTNKLVIDLVTVGAFDVNGTSVMLPQRVTPERHEAAVEQARRSPAAERTPGCDVFLEGISAVGKGDAGNLQRLVDWARGLEGRGLARLETTRGKGGRRFVLLPLLPAEDRALVTIWNDGRASLVFARSVFERKARASIRPVEELLSDQLGQEFGMGNGNTVWGISDELLDVLTKAYERAAESSPA